MVNPQALRESVDPVVRDPALSDNERKSKIEDLRKKTDLSEYSMRNLLIGLAHMYGYAADEASDFSMPRIAALNEACKRAEARFGKNSPQSKVVREQLNHFQSKIAPYITAFQQARAFLLEIYPPPREWFER